MNSAAFIVAIAAQVFSVGGAPPQGQLEVQYDLDVTAAPDVVPLGRTTTVIVSGVADAPLKTLKVEPSDGVTIGAVTPLAAPGAGRAAVSVAITVSSSAKPGERAITLTTTPEISGTDSVVRPGDGSRSKEFDQMFEAIIASQTKPRQVASLTINSHELTIVSARVIPRGQEDLQLEMRVNDAAGDIEVPPPPAPARGDLLVLVDDNGPIISEADCGTDLFNGVLGSVRRVSSSGGATVLTADVELPFEPTAPCRIRLRVRDRLSNLSDWFTLQMPARR